MARGLFWVVGLVGLVGCNAVMPLEKPLIDAGSSGDVAKLEAGTDAPSGGEAGVDAAVPDSQQPDSWPWFDGGAAVCNSLWVPTDKIQVSVADTRVAVQPSIAAIGNVFYVAYVEGGVVQVRRISPFDATDPVGAPVPLSTKSSYAHEDPWIIATSGPDLAVTWTEPTDISSTTCASDLMFRLLKDQGGTLTAFPSSCKLSVSAPMGYPRSSIALNQGTFVVAAPAEYNAPSGFACGEHTKGILHDFSAVDTCAASALPGPYDQALGTAQIVVAPLSSSSTNAFGVLRVHEPAPDVYELYWKTSTNGASWTGETKLNDLVLDVRPALVDDGAGGVFQAYVTNDAVTDQPQIALRHQGTAVTSAQLQAKANSGGFTEPFLARDGQTGQVLLVYARPGGSGASAAVLIDRLDVSVGGIVLSNATEVTGSATKPRTPVAVGGERGFGVAWVEEVSGHDEVFFKWVGCRP